MKKVLWFSRHVMTETQKKDLETRVGDSLTITQIDKTIKSIAEIEKEIHQYDILAAVLPVQLLAELKEASGVLPVVVSVSGRKEKENGGEKGKVNYQFEHLYWQEIVELRLTTKEFYVNGEKHITE